MALHPNSTGTQYIANVMNLGGSMAIAAGTVGEVRAAGSDTNGGLYYASQPGAGTDYSQQDAAQLTLTDIVTNGTSTVTSVTGGFTAAMIANGINIAGTSYMIATRVNTNTITVDRVIGAATGQTGNVGGAWATPGYASGQLTTSCQVWVKAGTYTLSSGTTNVSGGRVSSPGGVAGFPFRWEGYQTTRGDKGTKPIITDQSSGIGNPGSLVADSATFCIFDNIEVHVTEGGQGMRLQNTSTRLIRCKVTSGTSCIGLYVTASSGTELLFCEGSGVNPFYINGVTNVISCVAHDSPTTPGFYCTGANGATFIGCISYSNVFQGFDLNGIEVVCQNCTSDSNGTDGFAFSDSGAGTGLSAVNCLSTNNGGYGFNSAAANAFVALINCGTYNNTSGAVHNLSNAEGAIALASSPYANAPTNYGLGAGSLANAAGYPGAFPGLAATIGYPDLGAVQHQDAGGGLSLPVARII